MSRTAALGLAVLLVMFLAAGALAFGPGHEMGMMGGMGNLSAEQVQKNALFMKETLPLRQKMLQLKTELMGLRAQTKPDWNAVAAKQKEMVDVRIEIQKKAAETGAGRGIGMGNCGCGRMGMSGRGMGGGMSGETF